MKRLERLSRSCRKQKDFKKLKRERLLMSGASDDDEESRSAKHEKAKQKILLPLVVPWGEMPRVLEPADTCRTATTNSSRSISSNIHGLLLLLSLLTLHNDERTPKWSWSNNFILVPKKRQLCEETKKNSGSQRKSERERERSPSLAAITNDKSSCWRVQLGPSIDDPIPGINSHLKLAIASLDREDRARRCKLFEASQWSHCKCKTEFCRYLSFSTSLSCKCNST